MLDKRIYRAAGIVSPGDREIAPESPKRDGCHEHGMAKLSRFTTEGSQINEVLIINSNYEEDK
jgi:hypothetical protein